MTARITFSPEAIGTMVRLQNGEPDSYFLPDLHPGQTHLFEWHLETFVSSVTALVEAFGIITGIQENEICCKLVCFFLFLKEYIWSYYFRKMEFITTRPSNVSFSTCKYL
jgi:hypothetical protein